MFRQIIIKIAFALIILPLSSIHSIATPSIEISNLKAITSSQELEQVNTVLIAAGRPPHRPRPIKKITPRTAKPKINVKKPSASLGKKSPSRAQVIPQITGKTRQKPSTQIRPVKFPKKTSVSGVKAKIFSNKIQAFAKKIASQPLSASQKKLTLSRIRKSSTYIRPKNWLQITGALKKAAREKGDTNIGSANRKLANEMGKSWVGPNYRLASDKRTLVSKDGLRQYRPPTTKPNSRLAKTGIQANFESRTHPGKKDWINNAHLDIVD